MPYPVREYVQRGYDALLKAGVTREQIKEAVNKDDFDMSDPDCCILGQIGRIIGVDGWIYWTNYFDLQTIYSQSQWGFCEAYADLAELWQEVANFE